MHSFSEWPLVAKALAGLFAAVLLLALWSVLASVLFLVGTEIDYETTRLSSKFVFHNPNETDACGCGESVTIVPVAVDEPEAD